MGWFHSLFRKKTQNIENDFNNDNVVAEHSLVQSENEWQQLPEFVEVDSADYPLVSVIATSIAANDRPKSQFVIKRILQRNEEVKTVSLIAAALVASDSTNGQQIVRSISKKNEK